MKFQKEIASVLKASLSDTDMLNVVEALNYTAPDFQKAFDIALEMDNENLVKLIYANFNTGKIVVELTLPGIAESKRLKG